MASKRVIVSAEEIIEAEEFRRDPMRTTIPYFLVDAVVHAPFGRITSYNVCYTKLLRTYSDPAMF